MPRVCKAYRAKTNGKLERPFRCIRKGFFLDRTFRNLDDFNAQFEKWHGEIANPCVHATTGLIVDEMLAEEHSALIALPEQQREWGRRRHNRSDGRHALSNGIASGSQRGPPANAGQPQHGWITGEMCPRGAMFHAKWEVHWQSRIDTCQQGIPQLNLTDLLYVFDIHALLIRTLANCSLKFQILIKLT